MIEIKLTGNTLAELRVHVGALTALFAIHASEQLPITTQVIVPAEQPVDKPKRTRKQTEARSIETTAELVAVTQPPVDLFAAGGQQAKEDAKQPEQKDLIAALRAAYDKKADSAIAIVAHFNVKSVGQIPKDRWAEAIAMANKACAA